MPNISYLYKLHEEVEKRMVLSYLLEDERRLSMSGSFFFNSYDCRSLSLEARSIDLLKKISFFDKREIINSNRTTIDFHNENSYSDGSFDSVTFYDVEFGFFLKLTPKDGSYKSSGKCLLHFPNEEVMEFDNWMGFRTKLMKDEEFANMLRKRLYFE